MTRSESIHRSSFRFRRSPMTPPAIALALALAPFAAAEEPGSDAQRYWPQWRGPDATGVAPQGKPPVEWSESNNVRWKVAIPGSGHATPIVWGDRIYVQTSVMTDKKVEPKTPAEPEPEAAEPRRRPAREPGQRPDQPPGQRGRRGGRGGFGGRGRASPTNVYRFEMMALDRGTGNTIWKTTLCEEVPHESGHQDASQASNSPVTDGEHVIAYFGSRGVHCLDMNGKVLWKQDFGDMQTRNGFGEGSSPTLHGDTVVITWDHEGDSFIVALDKKTGKQKWKVDRDEQTSWATPLIVEADGKTQVVTSATRRVRSYDLKTGSLLWECGGMTANTIPSPMYADGLVYLISGFRGSALFAVRCKDAGGDVTGSDAVAWTYEGQATPYVPSALLYGDDLYFLDNNRAILSCVDAKTGKARYTKQRLEGLTGVYSSPVGADGRVYIVGRNGVAVVFQRGPEYKQVASNTLDDSFTASPVIVDRELILRGHENLYCIAAKE